MEKSSYETLKALKVKKAKNKPLTFQERNALTMALKNELKGKKDFTMNQALVEKYYKPKGKKG